jgi:hypothetical protein
VHKELARLVEAVAPEPSEEFLRAMCRHDQADDGPAYEEADI